MTTSDAITQSVRTNSIVTMDHDASSYETLLVECDDHVENGDVEEFWGTTESGDEWRVHMARVQEEV